MTKVLKSATREMVLKVKEFCEEQQNEGVLIPINNVRKRVALTAILSLYLRDKLGYTDDGATVIYHVFTMFAYFFPLLGAMIADGFLGRYRTILYLSLVYAAGSVLISMTAMPPLHFPALPLTMIALLLIAFGTGGIKPCVSAFGGDQFKLPEQAKYLGYFFSLFYFAINAGSLISTFITPMLRAYVHCFGENDCYSLAFGVPGILMIVSIICFVAGKRLYTIKTPAGNVMGKVAACIWHGMVQSFRSKDKRQHWLDNAEDKFERTLIEDIKSLLRVLVLFIPLPVFWALFDQQGSRWTFQADRMQQNIGGWTLKADQMQALNPFLILALIPLFEVAIYPCMTKCGLISKPLHKMIWGGLLAAAAFVISGIVELNLLPTYNTPLLEGYSHLRVYNGFNCNYNLTINEHGISKNHVISPLSMYENLELETVTMNSVPYILKGAEGDCSGYSYNGSFTVKGETGNSFFISKQGIQAFIDNNDKPIDGVNVRILVNSEQIVPVSIFDSSKNRSKLEFQSNDKEQKLLLNGAFDVIVAGQVVLPAFNFRTGAVYTINIYEDGNHAFVGNAVTITPANSVHILWLVPQYVVMTMGEVMFSVTGLEFSFTQAPASMKSVLQSVWLLTVAFGNLIVVLIVEGHFLDAQWKEFFLFAGLMAIDMIIFLTMALRYQYLDHSSSQPDLAIEEIRLPEKRRSNEEYEPTEAK